MKDATYLAFFNHRHPQLMNKGSDVFSWNVVLHEFCSAGGEIRGKSPLLLEKWPNEL